METVAEPGAPDVSPNQAVRRCPRCGEPVISLPVLRCSHCDAIRVLRAWCYKPEPGVYLAECIDLDIVTEGKTADEAIAGLENAVCGYLKVAFSGDTHGLVLRKSPWRNRLRYRSHRLWCFVKLGLSGGHRHYAAPCIPTTLKPCT
jgi:hypothetical protein